MISRGVSVFDDHFDRAQILTTTPGMNGWTLAKTASGGSPTAQCVTADGGAIALTLAATSEAEILSMYQNDVLFLDPASLQRIDIEAQVSGVDSVTTIVFGLANARNDAVASVTNCAWFKILGSTSTSNVVIDTKDGTNSNTNIATGVTLSSTPKKFSIDFTNGLADVRFFVDGERVAASTVFNLSAIGSGNFQPIVQIQKASGTGVAAVQIARFATQQKYAYGA